MKGAKQLLTRSLQSLSKHKHIEVITKYGLTEYEYGSIDHGRVIFEELLANYPTRTDLWHVFVDREIKIHSEKGNNSKQVRLIFNRMIQLKISMKNIKNIFKKYVSFEQTHGNEVTVNEVAEKAKAFVANIIDTK